MSSRRVLVTGLTGGLGRALASHLPPGEVIAVDRRPPPPGLASRLVQEDIATLRWGDHLDAATVVVHLAAAVHVRPGDEAEVRQMYRTNAEATARLAAACREAGSTLVFASTVAVFGGAPGPVGDGALAAPVTDYAKSKLLAEEAVRAEGARGLGFAIVRFPLLYGPWGRGNMERMLRAIGRRAYWPLGDQSAAKSALFFDDAAGALLLAAQAPGARQGTFVVGPGKPPSLAEIHAAAYRAMGRRRPPAMPGWLALPAARAADAALRLAGRDSHLAEQVATLTAPASFDGSRFAKVTGFEVKVTLEEGMARTAAWLREGGHG